MQDQLTDESRLAKVAGLEPIAADMGATLAQFSPAWCLQNSYVSTVMTGASRVEQAHEYMYQHLLLEHQTSLLSGEQIRDGWMTHIYSDENTPFIGANGKKENFLWVSNQRAHDLMRS